MKSTIISQRWIITLLLLLAWTIIIGSITIFNTTNEHKQTETLLLDQYRLLSAVLKTSWKWNSLHGGVFVSSNDSLTLSQYLDEENRMIISTQGDTLIKVVPVVMSEEMTALSGTHKFYDTRIVSNNPMASCIPLEALDSYELVHASEQGLQLTSGNLTPQVKIFEYTE